MVLVTGERQEKHLLTYAIRDNRFQPITAQVAIGLDDAPKIALNPRDRIIDLGAYDPAHQTMMFEIWYGRANQIEEFPRSAEYSVAVASFSTFGVAVAYSFLDSPTPGTAPFIEYSTAKHVFRRPELDAGFRPQISQGVIRGRERLVVIRDFNHLCRLIENPPARYTPFDPGPLREEGPLFIPTI